MTDPIVSRSQIRALARSAFDAGRKREDHGMNPGAAAIEEWQDEWDRAYADWAHPEASDCSVRNIGALASIANEVTEATARANETGLALGRIAASLSEARE